MWRKARIKEHEESIRKNMVGRVLWYKEGSEYVPSMCQELSVDGPTDRFIYRDTGTCVITHVTDGHKYSIIPLELLEPLEETLIEPPIEHYLEWWKEEQ